MSSIQPAVESVAKALLINDESEVLVLTLGEHKQRPEKSFKPDLPGGLVDPGETERDAVRREVMEETGIEIDPSLLTMVYSGTEFIADENKSVSKHLFVTRIPGETRVTLSWEHSAYEWVTLAELGQGKLRSFYDEAIQYCLSNGLLSDAAQN